MLTSNKYLTLQEFFNLPEGDRPNLPSRVLNIKLTTNGTEGKTSIWYSMEYSIGNSFARYS